MAEGLPSGGEVVPKNPKVPEKAKESSKASKARRANLSADPAVLVCKKEKPDSVLIKPGCNLEIADKKDKLKFLEALRSAPAFEEMADKLPKYVDLSKRELSAIYPGSGAHIATLAMAARLIDKNLIDKATFTQTDIKDERVDDLWKNLNFLAKANPDFKIDKMVKRKNATGGYAVDFKILYKGKEILITLLIRASGDDYFHKNDFKKANLFISHDSAENDPHLGMMFMFTKYIDAVRKTGKNIPIVMENVGQYINTDDWFMSRALKFGNRGDLPLFGKFESGTKPYGHREAQRHKGDQGEEIRVETGKPYAKNVVILKPHAELLKIDPKALDIMADISGFALNGEHLGMSHRENLATDRAENQYPFAHVVGYGEYLLDNMKSVSPNLERGLALRILLGMHNFHSYGVRGYLQKYYNKNPEVGVNKIFKLIDRCVASLGKEDQQYLVREISILKKNIEVDKKYVDVYRHYNGLLNAKYLAEREIKKLREDGDLLYKQGSKLKDDAELVSKTVSALRRKEGGSTRVIAMVESHGVLVGQSNKLFATAGDLWKKAASKKNQEVEGKKQEIDVEFKKAQAASEKISHEYKWSNKEFTETVKKFTQRGNAAFVSKK